MNAASLLVKWAEGKRGFGCVGIKFAVTVALICLVFDTNFNSITLCLFVPHFKALFFCRNRLHILSDAIAPLASHWCAECSPRPKELKNVGKTPVFK
jgi:hypothetical protein